MLKGLLSTLKGKIIVAAVGVLVVVGIVVTVVVVTSPQDYRTIKIEELNGQTIISNESSSLQDAYEGMNLKSGDVVTVQEDGNMTLLFDMNKYMFADAGTKFTVVASGNSEKSNTKTRIVLEEGSVLCRLDSKLGGEESFEVETPNSVMSVRGTIFKMTIYKDENGDNYARVDVLEGSVKVDLYNENGEKTGEEGLIEAGQAATVHSNTDLSEFVIGESNISYDDFSGPMAEFVVNTVDTGREICIGEDLFKHYTGLETHPEEGKVIKEATCASEGEKEIYCSTCDAVVRTEPIPALEHTPGEWELKSEGNCKEKATEALICTECGGEIEVRELELGDHIFGDWKITTEATCEKEGVETRTCEICGETETKTIKKTDHTFGEFNVLKEASCESAGSRNHTCSGCGEVETQTVAALGHSYGAWNVITAAGCETTGLQSHTCSTCGKTENQTIAALGHLVTHSSTATHLAEGNTSDCVVGGSVNVCVYLYCDRCGAEQIAHVTGTVTQVYSGYSPNFTCNICGARG